MTVLYDTGICLFMHAMFLSLHLLKLTCMPLLVFGDVICTFGVLFNVRRYNSERSLWYGLYAKIRKKTLNSSLVL